MKRKEVKDLTKNKKKINIKANNNLMEEGIVLEQGKYKITMLPLEENKNPSIYKKEGLVKFKKFNKQDDLEYEVKENCLKENIIISEVKEEYKYEFLLKLTNLTFDELDKTFKDLETNKPIFKLLDLVMFDASKVESKDIEELVTKLDNNDIKLTIIPNKEWLNHKERDFPVTLDPSFEVVEEDIIEMRSYDERYDDDIFSRGVALTGYANAINNITSVTINVQNLINEINVLGLTRYKSLLKLSIIGRLEEDYCGYYLVTSGTSRLFSGKLPNNELLLDITALVGKAVENEEGTISLDITNDTMNNIDSRELDAIGRVIQNDYIEIASTYYEDEKYRPKLTLEYLSSEARPEQDATITYDLDIQGQTNVNLYDGSFIHEVPLANISENSLQADLSLVFNKRLFDDTSIDKEEKYINKGFKTNMHQYLVKEENFNPLTGGRKITYVDGQGFTHELIEKWYYEDEDNVKHFVPKDDVFLDDDGLIKVQVVDKVYEIKYEVENDEGLSYVSASSMYNYKPKNIKRYIVKFGYGDREIKIENNKIKSVTYYYISPITGNKVYVRPCDIHKNDYGELLGPTNQYVYVDIAKTLDVKELENGQKYYVCKYTYFTGEQDGEFFGETSANVNIIEESTEIFEENDIYENENITQLSNRIKEVKKAIIETQSNKNNILISYANCLQQYKFSLEQMEKKKQLIEAQEYIREKQNWLKGKQLKFYREIGNTALLETIINEGAYVDNLYQDNANSFYYSKEIIEILKSEHFNPESHNIHVLNGFANLYQYGSMVMCDEQTYKDNEELQHQLSLEIQNDNDEMNINLLSNQISLFEEQYTNINSNLDYYIGLLKSYEIQKDALIGEQRKQVNDYIVDKSGNMLGFNGFGQLIMLIDKYENQININYDENNKKIESISNKTQTILFKYTDNSQLESVIDQYGKVSKFEYGENELYIYFKYLNNRMIKLVTKDNWFEVVDDLDRALEITIDNYKVDKIKRTIDSSCRISNDSITKDEEYNELITDAFEYELNKTKITNIYDEVKEIMFDTNGRLLNIIDDKDVRIRRVEDNKLMFDVSYNEDKHVLDYINDAAGVSKSMYITFDLNDNDIQDLINKHKMLGLVIELGDLNVNSSEHLQHVKLSVNINDGEYQFEQEYYEVENQTLVLPFAANFNAQTVYAKVSFNEDVNLSNIKGFKLVALTGSIYTYDDQDRLEFVDTGLTTTEYFDYVNDKPTQSEFVDQYGRVTTSKVIYDSKDRLAYQEDSNGNVKECFYDDKDNLIEERTYNKKDPTMSSVKKYNYDECGNVTELDGLLKDKNGLKHNTKLEYVPGTSLVRKISNSNNVKCFGYDRQTNELLSFSSNGDQVNNSNRFTYNYGLMTSMSHHGQSVKYTYDSLGRVTNVNLFGIEDYIKTSYYDNKLYSDNHMRLENASWSVTTYANGRLKITVYDKDGKLVKLKDDDRLFYYTYDEEDRLLKDEITYYEYDNNGLVINKQTPFIYSKYIYDEYDRLTQEETSINSLQTQVVTSYEYDDLDQVVSTTIDDNFKVTYERDCLNRTIKENTLVNNVGRLSEEYVYLQEEDNTTNLIKEHVFKYFNSVTDINTYEYDEHGNITNIEDIEGNKTRYTYDSLNRLVREDNSLLNKTITIKYDAGGNILFKKEHPYTLEDELPICSNKYLYGYASNKEWKDRLVSFNGKSIVNDEYGRPSCYKEDALTWNNFNQLVTYKKENETNKLNFVYNEYGIRIRKYKDDYSLDISYVVDGNKVLAMLGNIDNSNVELVFRYSLDKLKGFTYNNIEYIYKRNIQGDITQIINDSGDVVAKYIYDAWGNHNVLNPDGTENTDSLFIGNINPFRYRGYLFDPETNLYYLNSRYYDSEVGRFISPDSIEYLDPESTNGLNLYCYCGNNPVMYVDPSGNNFKNFLKAVGLVLLSAVIIVGIAALVALTGGLAAIALGATLQTVGTIMTGAFICGVAYGSLNVLGQGFTNGFHNIDLTSVAIDTFTGSVYGALSGIGAVSTIGSKLAISTAIVINNGTNTLLHGLNEGKRGKELWTEVGKTCLYSAGFQIGSFVVSSLKFGKNGVGSTNNYFSKLVNAGIGKYISSIINNSILKSEWVLGVKALWKYIKGEY